MNSSNISPGMQEAAKAELQRRQSLREAAQQELERRKSSTPQQSIQQSTQGPKIDPSQLPGSGISQFLMGALQNSGSPKDVLMSRLNAAKQGALDLGQGAKQLGFSALERMGSVPQGTTQNYTGNTDLQRLQYEQSPGSQDMISRIIRSGISNSPYLALGPGGEAGLIAKLAKGAAGGAGIGAASYAGQDQSRLANAIGGAATGAAVPAIGALGSKLKGFLSDIPGSIENLRKIPSSISNYLQPSKDSNKLLSSLAGTADHNIETNAQNLTKDTRDAYNKNVKESLSYLEKIPENQKLFDIKESPKSVGEMVKKKLDENNNNFSEDEQNYLSKNLTTKDGKLILKKEKEAKNSRRENPDVNGSQTKNPIEYMGTLKKEKTGFLSSDIKSLQNELFNNPSFKNANELKKQIGFEAAYANGRVRSGQASPTEAGEATTLNRLYNSIKTDIRSNLPETHRDNFDLHSHSWESNVTPYAENQELHKVITDRKGKTAFHSNDINSFFHEPSPSAQKVLSDIGESGQKKVLYNKLIDSYRSPSSVGQALQDLQKKGGYSTIIDPQKLKLATELQKRSHHSNMVSNILKASALGAGGGLGLELFKHLYNKTP